ncbi:hypothetical protein CIB84_009660, partial [Bambusicola thoracicus]
MSSWLGGAELRAVALRPVAAEDREAQEDELLALASIYDEDEFKRAEAAQGGETRICLELPPNFRVVVS